MYTSETAAGFFAALAPLLIKAGGFDRGTVITTENLDYALRQYIKSIIDDYEYERNVFDA